MTFTEQAFVVGYNHGSIGGSYCSRFEAEQRFPKWNDAQIEAYLNGRDDGVAGDSWRVGEIYRKYEMTAEPSLGI